MNNKKNFAFNPDMLFVAREFRGMSQSSLAKKLGISQALLSKIENRVSDADDVVISKFVQALQFPKNFFYNQGRAYGQPLSIHSMFRKNTSVRAKALNKLSSELNIRIMNLDCFLRSVHIETDLPLPSFDIDDYDSDPETIAAMVRRTWLIKDGPISNLTEYVEKAGIVIFWCDFDYANIDGVSLNIPNSSPCIFLNQNKPSDRMRFSLAHELGHIIMHRNFGNNLEREANQFASALLMPRKDITLEFTGKITLAKLALLKRVWRVSMQALLYRGKHLDLISYNQSDYLWRKISALGYRKQEPLSTEFPYEYPSTLSNIIRLHQEQLDYSITDLASASRLREDDFKNLYRANLNKPMSKLRLVK